MNDASNARQTSLHLVFRETFLFQFKSLIVLGKSTTGSQNRLSLRLFTIRYLNLIYLRCRCDKKLGSYSKSNPRFWCLISFFDYSKMTAVNN